jgi:hypothetical protein
MKKILCLIPLLAVSAFGQPEVLPALICSGVSTSTVVVTATSQTLSGYVNALKVVVSGGKTCTVTIATGLSTIYTTAAATGTVVVRPVVQNSTNGTLVASFDKPCLASDAITVTASTITDSGTATVTVTPVIERNP